jgi:hypothetical protein
MAYTHTHAPHVLQRYIRTAFSKEKSICYGDLFNYCQRNIFDSVSCVDSMTLDTDNWDFELKKLDLEFHRTLWRYFSAGLIYPVRWREQLEFCMKEAEDFIEAQINDENNSIMRELNRPYTKKEMAQQLPEFLYQATIREGVFPFGIDSFSICESKNPCILFQAIFLTLKSTKKSTPPWIGHNKKAAKQAYMQVSIEATRAWSLPGEEPYVDVKWKAHSSLFTSHYLLSVE